MPRPRKPTPSLDVVIHLRLDPVRDADLIELFSRVPPRGKAALVKAALRGADLRTFLPPSEEERMDAALDRLALDID